MTKTVGGGGIGHVKSRGSVDFKIKYMSDQKKYEGRKVEISHFFMILFLMRTFGEDLTKIL